ncbi:MAG: DNA translocase FtsK 4TM domain-containing protein, partial [Bacteroidota bacterium]
MAKIKKTAPLDKKNDAKTEGNNPLRITKQHKIVFGSLLVLFSIALLFAFISFFIYGQQDQSAVRELTNRAEIVHNWLGKFGAFLADLLIYRGFGIAAFIFVRLFFLTGIYMVLGISLGKLKNIWFWDLFVIIILSVLFGFFATSAPELGGTVGYELNLFLQDYIGKTGTLLILLFGLIIYIIFKIKLSPESIQSFFDTTKKEMKAIPITNPLNNGKSGYNLEEFAVVEDELDDIHLKTNGSQFEINKEALKPTISNSSDINRDPVAKPLAMQVTPVATPEVISNTDESFVIESAPEEDIIEENLASRLVADFGLFDPTLDLSNYKFPTIDLLKEYSTGGITINQEELEENKNRIVDTLRNYKIEIAQIKATVGPSVTLYEIVPEAGIRISKIKSLEDDIALSLSALGIRIIAPIPGKGTIGIEVPNKNPTMVSMKSVIGSAKFQEAEMELPIALGKTISNETFVVDLAKMPHLLMAGATGQGKSVGL